MRTPSQTEIDLSLSILKESGKVEPDTVQFIQELVTEEINRHNYYENFREGEMTAEDIDNPVLRGYLFGE